MAVVLSPTRRGQAVRFARRGDLGTVVHGGIVGGGDGALHRRLVGMGASAVANRGVIGTLWVSVL